MTIHNYQEKVTQTCYSINYSSRSATTRKCSSYNFHCVKCLFVIVAMSLVIKASFAVKVAGGNGGDNRTERSAELQVPRNSEVLTKSNRDRKTRTSAEKELISELIRNYYVLGKEGRPVCHDDEVINITFGLSLIQIMNVDESNQILKLSLWYRYKWTDFLMRWTPSLHDNVKVIRIPSNKIWTPDINLYNFADDRINEQREAMLVIHSDGSIEWAPQAVLRSSCVFDTKYFPFDRQRCYLKFGSWTYSTEKLDVKLWSHGGFNLDNFIPCNEWNILSNNATRNVIKYTCCLEPFTDVTFELTLERKRAFYTFILILPCTLLSLLTHVIFWVPPESPAKLQLGMSVFIAFFFLLMVLSEFIPRAAPTLPLIGAFFGLCMIMITLSTLLACVVCNMHFRGIRTERPPAAIRWIIGSRLARAVSLIETPTQQLAFHINKRDNTEIDNKYQNDNRDQNHNHYHFQDLHHSRYQQQQNNHIASTDSDNVASTYSTLFDEVRAIRCSLIHFEMIMRQTEERDNVLQEWHILASIVDRLFFIIFLILNIFTSVFVLTVM